MTRWPYYTKTIQVVIWNGTANALVIFRTAGVSLAGEGKEWKSALRNAPHASRGPIRGCRVDLPVWVSLRLAIQLVAPFMPITNSPRWLTCKLIADQHEPAI